VAIGHRYQGHHPGGRKQPLCPECGAELTTNQEQRENICQSLKCRGPWLQRTIAAQKQKERDQQEALNESARTSLKNNFPEVLQATENGDLLFIVVPGIEGEQASPTEERIAEFRETLEEAFAEAERLVADPDRAADLLRGYEPQREDSGALPIVNACSTCRGWCCQMGRFNAFLKPEFLAWRLVNEHDLTAEDMIDDYLSRIPELSQQNSCLFHTDRGCALPWQIRSSTCNTFQCPGLSQFRSAIEESPEQASAAVSLKVEGYFSFGIGEMITHAPGARLGVMESDGNRTEHAL